MSEMRKIPDSSIDYSDIPETDAQFWARANLKMPKPKEQVSIGIDQDVLRWFRKKGRDYETRMNAVLRSYMESGKGSDTS